MVRKRTRTYPRILNYQMRKSLSRSFSDEMKSAINTGMLLQIYRVMGGDKMFFLLQGICWAFMMKGSYSLTRGYTHIHTVYSAQYYEPPY